MPGRVSVGGADTSTTKQSKLPQNANHGALCLTDDLAALHVFEGASRKKWLPIEYVPFTYDPVVHGGGIGSHGLNITIPAGMIVVDGILDIIRSFAASSGSSSSSGSSGAPATPTLAITVEGAGDVLTATAVGSLTAGLKDIVPVGTAATSIKTTVERTVTAVVAATAFGSGKLNGFLRVVRSSTT